MSTSITWVSLLEEKGREVEKKLGSFATLKKKINTGRMFRESFEKLCLKHREKKATRLYAVLSPSLISIVGLAHAVDQSLPDQQQQPSADSLEGLIWRLIYAVLEASRFVDRSSAEANLLCSMDTESKQTLSGWYTPWLV